MTIEGVAGIARHVVLLDDHNVSANLPAVKPKHEMPEREHHPPQWFATS
jgi:hypothetical protein